MNLVRRAFPLALATALAACSGSGSNAGIPSGGSTPGGGGSTSTARAVFTVTIGFVANLGLPVWFPAHAATLSASVSPAAGPAPSPVPCTQTLSSCTIALNAPVGQDVFTFTLSDAANVALATATAAQTILANQTNTVKATFAGIPGSVTLNVSPAALLVSQAGTATIVATAFDADGDEIQGGLGPNYAPPITVTVSDPANVHPRRRSSPRRTKRSGPRNRKRSGERHDRRPRILGLRT